MKIEFEGRTYHLREELTGQDFLDLRRAAVNKDGNVDMGAYGHANIMRRLRSWDREEDISEAAVLALPLKHYQVLYSSSLRLEAREGEEVNDFLLNLWQPSKPEVAASTSTPSAPRHRAGRASSSSEAE